MFKKVYDSIKRNFTTNTVRLETENEKQAEIISRQKEEIRKLKIQALTAEKANKILLERINELSIELMAYKAVIEKDEEPNIKYFWFN